LLNEKPPPKFGGGFVNHGERLERYWLDADIFISSDWIPEFQVNNSWHEPEPSSISAGVSATLSHATD
jgi:hypothetical protein